MSFESMYELTPQWDHCRSFYGKAHVLVEASGKLTLRSYSTNVAVVEKDEARVFGTYSATTLRHIKEFLRQNGFGALSKKQIEELVVNT